MSNRAFKLHLWEKNPHCHWCGELTELTNCPDGKIPNNAATIDHLYSRYDVRRWVKRKPGEVKKVLACYACNQRRSIEETARLSKEEIFMRSQGFSLNPTGKPHIIKTLDTIEEVALILKEKGVDIPLACDMVTV